VPIGTEIEERPVTPVRESATSVLSIATMHYPPNAEAIRWFLTHVFPLLSLRHPNLRCEIAGSRPPSDIVEWAARDNRVNVHGYVEELTDLYQEAAVFIVPLLSGSGVRVKILEAMAHGIPVVSTSIGADGLEFRHGEQIMIADTPEDFASAISTLVEQPELRYQIAQAARARVLELYDWRRCCRPILDAYRSFDGLPEVQRHLRPGRSQALPTP
jgi:glycosyltransferase involved in cell wall biosynthesis